MSSTKLDMRYASDAEVDARMRSGPVELIGHPVEFLPEAAMCFQNENWLHRVLGGNARGTWGGKLSELAGQIGWITKIGVFERENKRDKVYLYRIEVEGLGLEVDVMSYAFVLRPEIGPCVAKFVPLNTFVREH